MSDLPSFESWASESGWIVGESCALCALPKEVLRELETAWIDCGAREAELSAYLAALGILVSSTEPFARHFRTSSH